MFLKNKKRIILAAAMSFGLFAATEIWHRNLPDAHVDYGDEKSIAFIQDLKDDVERLPTDRQIWLTPKVGDQLYPGESVRTATDSQASIRFTDGQSAIDLEPESLIVITQNTEGTTVELKAGAITVHPRGRSAHDAHPIFLKSTHGKINLSEVMAHISKTKLSDILKFEIFGGQAHVESPTGKQSNIAAGDAGSIGDGGISLSPPSLKILSPVTDDVVYVTDNEKVHFAWEGMPPGSSVRLQMGTARTSVADYAVTEKPADKFIDLQLSTGKYQWKIIAQNHALKKDVAESFVYPLDLKVLSSPQPVQPMSKSEVLKDGKNPVTKFRWQKAGESIATTVEIARDAGLRNRVLVKEFADEEEYTMPLELGQYYWRLTAHYVLPKEKVVSGPVMSFKVVEKLLPQVAIDWQLPKTDSPQFYWDKPVMVFAWGSRGDMPKTWKIRLTKQPAPNSRQPASNLSKSLEGAKTKFDFEVPGPGSYVATIEAYDETGHMVSATEARTIHVAPQPLLGAPQITATKINLLNDGLGGFDLKWSPIAGAKEYTIFVKGTGKTKKQTEKSVASKVSGLLPGAYNVQISAIDARGRVGEKSSVKQLVIPNQSGVASPKLKQLRVE